MLMSYEGIHFKLEIFESDEERWVFIYCRQSVPTLAMTLAATLASSAWCLLSAYLGSCFSELGIKKLYEVYNGWYSD